MLVNKHRGKVFGASLTVAERKALEAEISKEYAKRAEKLFDDFDAVILWKLHECFGFGPYRLKQFYDNFADGIDDLLKHYELDGSDIVWICDHKLKEYGIDIEKWKKEREERKNNERKNLQ